MVKTNFGVIAVSWVDPSLAGHMRHTHANLIFVEDSETCDYGLI